MFHLSYRVAPASYVYDDLLQTDVQSIA